MLARLLTAFVAAIALLFAAATAPAQKPDQGQAEKPRLVSKVYQVADLVVPIAPAVPVTPVTATCLPDLQAPCAATCANPGATTASLSHKPATDTIEAELISLIKNTIAPSIWNDQGGPCSMEYYPLGLALVINAPLDIQEQIQDLLAALRRAQDHQVAFEVRFVCVTDDCLDQLKTSFKLKEHKSGSIDFGDKPGPMAVLDDKQIVKFMEAAQSDLHTHVMQSPKITALNGQEVPISLCENRVFATSMKIGWNGKEMAFVPVHEAISLGLQMSLQPVMSADRNKVCLNLSATQTSLETDTVRVAPVILAMKRDPASGKPTGFAQSFPTSYDGKFSVEVLRKKDDDTIILTQFLQTPKIAKHTLDQTRLTIPDGKTAVLFGWNQTSESTEVVPVLSKLPLLGKNFQHVRQTLETVLVLVTPRVIVQAEEERQTGFLCPPCVCPGSKAVLEMTHADTACRSCCTQEKQVANAAPKYQPQKPQGGGEEQEPPSLDEVLAKYHKACAAGKLKTARKYALKALAIDPTCFDKK